MNVYFTFYHERLTCLIVKTHWRKFLTFYLTVSRTSCIYFVTFEDVVLILLKDLKTKLCKHNQKEVESVHYIRVYAKGVLKNGFVYVETSDANLLYQLRSKPLTHQRDFDLRLCLVPNKIVFVLSWPKCIINLLWTNQSHKLEKSLSTCFSISVTFLCLKTMQVSSA